MGRNTAKGLEKIGADECQGSLRSILVDAAKKARFQISDSDTALAAEMEQACGRVGCCKGSFGVGGFAGTRNIGKPA